MSQFTYRGNLTNAGIPFLTEQIGATVISAGIDQEGGIPQIYYAHNVVPSLRGVTAVGYLGLVSPPANTDNTFDEIFFIRDPNENVAYLGVTTSGRCYVWLSSGSGWLQTTSIGPGLNGLVTVAHVNGQSYINFSGVGTYRYDFATNTLIAVVLAGIVATAPLAIAASNGYMVFITASTFYWSSTLDPTDFVPSLITGAGSESIQEAKAALTICLTHDAGVMIYTKKNAISAAYSNNVQYPWIYKEVSGAGGLSKPSLVASDGNSMNHFSYTTNGLQEIAVNNSAIVFPELTDFIAGAKFEDYDEVSNTFTEVTLAPTMPMKKKLTIVANRYFVFSYGVTQLTHALIFDLALKRWGKLKITHVDCFEYLTPINEVIETPKRSIGFMQADGTLYSTNLSYENTGSYGTVILGRYQLDREHFLGLHEIHLETIKTDAVLNAKVLTTIDGVNYTTYTPYLASAVGKNRRYNNRSIGLNHSVVLSGSFQLNSIKLRFTDEGEIR